MDAKWEKRVVIGVARWASQCCRRVRYLVRPGLSAWRVS
jgi:hypothetical protein